MIRHSSKSISISVVALALSFLPAACSSEMEPSSQNDVMSEVELFERFKNGPRVSAVEASNLMQKYCAANFPNEESISSQLKRDNFVLSRNGRTWFHPTKAANIVIMESPTGRGYGCAFLFHSGSQITDIAHNMEQNVEVEGTEAFSVWMKTPGGSSNIQPIVNHGKSAPDAVLLKLPVSNNNQFTALLTEK